MIDSLLDTSDFASAQELASNTPTDSLEFLFETGQYEAVSRASAQRLQKLHVDSDDVLDEAAETWVWRMRALLSLGLGAQVAEETKRNLASLPQTDFLDEKNKALWDLAILVLPVFQNGFNEAAIKELYRYVEIARQAAQQASTDQLKQLWQGRLHYLLLYIVGVLLGLKDYDAAIDLLQHGMSHTKNRSQSEQLALVLSLIFIQLGNTNSAKSLAAGLDSSKQKLVQALLQFVETRSVVNSDDFQIEVLDALGGLLTGNFARAEQLIQSNKYGEDKYSETMAFLKLLLIKGN